MTRDAGDICEVCGQVITWVDHLPPLDASSPVRCHANVRVLRPRKPGERLLGDTVLYSAAFLNDSFSEVSS
jgi:hypothetical protein